MPERQLKTYGRQFTMTREAFINDDIGLLTTMPQRYAALSANTQNKLVYQILTQNKKIYDGKALFSAERGNTLQKGTKPTIESIERMIYLLGMQKTRQATNLCLCRIVYCSVGYGNRPKNNSIFTYYTYTGKHTKP